MSTSKKPLDKPELVQTITINVMTVMDVNAIISYISSTNQTIGATASSALAIPHSYIYMSSDDASGWNTTNGPADINLNAIPGDTISFYTTSMDGNSNTAAYIVLVSGGSPVLNPSTVNVVELQGAAQPTAPDGYPFNHADVSFSSCDVKVARQGTAQNFWMTAALFETDNTGENQVLQGYVKWDPTVVVS